MTAGFSRAGIVAVLLAVELAIAGLMVWTVGGFHAGSWSGGGFVHRVDYVAPPIAPVAAGASPVVTIDDVDSHVVVSPSSDGLVHVTDETSVHGWLVGYSHAQVLTVTRTPSGVRIFRPEGHFAIGLTNDRVRVQVPVMTRLTIARADSVNVSGLRNGATIHTDDGHIAVSNLRGNAIDLESTDGRIDVRDLKTTGSSPNVTMSTTDGSIHVRGVFTAGGHYSLQSNDGRIDVMLFAGSNVTVAASSSDGSIHVNGDRHASHTLRVGNGDAAMRVQTEDGSIHLTTNGA